jgi:hypothetical protein
MRDALGQQKLQIFELLIEQHEYEPWRSYTIGRKNLDDCT